MERDLEEINASKALLREDDGVKRWLELQQKEDEIKQECKRRKTKKESDIKEERRVRNKLVCDSSDAICRTRDIIHTSVINIVQRHTTKETSKYEVYAVCTKMHNHVLEAVAAAEKECYEKWVTPEEVEDAKEDRREKNGFNTSDSSESEDSESD